MTAPNKLLIPAICNEKIAKSTLGPLWLCIPARGGYKVQPVPTPPSIQAENINNNKLGGNNQKLILLSLGNLIFKQFLAYLDYVFTILI